MSKKPAVSEVDPSFEGDESPITQATVDAAVKSTRDAILATQKQVNALCRIAKRPELAASFNESGKSVAEVVAELDKLGPVTGDGKDTRDGTELSARHAPDHDGKDGVVIDSVSIFEDWNHPGRITARMNGRA